MPDIVKDFESVAEVVEFAKVPAGFAENQLLHGRISSRQRAEDWYGVNSRETAERILQCGEWPEGVQRMRDALRDLGSLPAPIDARRRRVRADAGAEVDITAYWRGRADIAWEKCARRSVRAAATVRLYVNSVIAAREHSDGLFWRGAAALYLADTLTDAGYNVEIWAVRHATNAWRGARGSLTFRTLVKSALAPLDINALAVTVALPAFTRHVYHLAHCAMPDFECADGLGQPGTYSSDEQGAIVINAANSADAAARLIREALDSINAGE